MAQPKDKKPIPTPEKPTPERIQQVSEHVLHGVQKLLNSFWVERWLYLALTVISFLGLLAGFIMLFGAGKADTVTMTAMFGSSGLFAASSTRVTLMFGKAFDLFANTIQKLIK